MIQYKILFYTTLSKDNKNIYQLEVKATTNKNKHSTERFDYILTNPKELYFHFTILFIVKNLAIDVCKVLKQYIPLYSNSII